ncbi:hypothetical protein F4808DRAFT_411380 [Astrocystis sublimbata]|nr:hypothetical protein F4808DRAFT_411380 [Astrocystis sublimbata]
MRFAIAVFVSLFATAMAIPPTSDTFAALDRKCIASGASCDDDHSGCCSGICGANHGCGCYTCN